MTRLLLKEWSVLGVWVLVCVGFVPGPCWGQTTADTGTAAKGWMRDYESAKKMSQELGVPMLIHFYADWCGPCQRMEQDVLQTADVRNAISSGIVAVKVNSDRRRDLVRQFGIATLPSDVFISSSGRVLSKTAGSPGRSSYVAQVHRFRETDLTIAAKPVFNSSKLSENSDGSHGDGESHGDDKAVSHQNKTVDIRSADNDSQAEVAASANITGENGSASTQVAHSSSETKQSPVHGAEEKKLTKVLRREAEKRIGLNGYSPVALLDSSQWKVGNKKHRHQYQGVCYLLGSLSELQSFQADPSRFIPALHGYDPVSFKADRSLVTGAIELGVRYRDRVYFFATKTNRDRFLKFPSRYAQEAELSFSMSLSNTEMEL